MGLNNMGVGFNFTGRDSGLGKAIGAVKSGFSGLASAAGGAVKGVTSLSAQALTGKSSFAAASSEMRVTTTGIEQFGIAADVVTSKVFAGMGRMSVSVKKAKSIVTGLAYGMNRPVDSIAESFKALEQQGIDVTKHGFKNFDEFIKFADVANLDTKAWAASQGLLKKTVGFTDTQLADLNKTTVALGTKMNLGTEAMGNMVQMTDIMQQSSDGLFVTWGPKRTKQFLESGTALTGLFMKAGASSDKAAMLAQNLTQTVMKGKNSFDDIYRGTASDLGSLSKILGENLGDIDQSFALLQKDPLQFATALNKAFQQIKATGKAPEDLERIFSRLTGQLAGDAGPELTRFLYEGMTPLGKEAEQISAQLLSNKGLAGKDGAINGISKAFRSGLTPAAEYARILDRFQTRLKHVAGVNDNQFNASLRTSGKEMTANIVGMKSKYQGIGKFFDTAIEVQNHGFGGLLGNLDKSFLAMNMLTQNMGPVGAGIMNLGLMFYKAGQGGDGFKKKMDHIREQLTKFGQGAGQFINDMVAGFKVLWPEIQKGATDALVALSNTLGGPGAKTASDAIANIFNKGIGYLKSPAFQAFMTDAWEGFKKMLLGLYNALAGDKMQANGLGDAIGKIWEAVKPRLKYFVTGLMIDMFQMIGESGIPGLSGLANKVTEGLTKSMIKQEAAMKGLKIDMGKVDDAGAAGLQSGIGVNLPSNESFDTSRTGKPSVMIPSVSPDQDSGHRGRRKRPRPAVSPAGDQVKAMDDLKDSINNPDHAAEDLAETKKQTDLLEQIAAQRGPASAAGGSGGSIGANIID